MRPIHLLAATLSLLAIPAIAAPYQPKLKSSKDGSIHTFPLGVLGATGQLSDGESAILITDLAKEGVAAKAGLQVGDRLETIDGVRPEPFSKSTETGLAGPQAVLGKALDRAGAGALRSLKLGILRGEASKTLAVSLPAGAAFAKAFPSDCQKTDALVRGIAEYLVKTQRDNGSWKPGVGGDADVYTAAHCGMALLAAGDRKHVPAVRQAIEFVRGKSIAGIDLDDPTKGPKNWQTAANAVLLAEYQLATGDTRYRDDLKKCCDFLASRVTDNGTMGHHFAIPYNGGGLVIINVQAHLAWALAEKCGCEIDDAAWGRSLGEVRKSIDRRTGAIGYSARATWSPDISARTGAMAAALAVRGEEPDLAAQLAAALTKHDGRMRHAHAMSSIGLIYGFAGLAAVAPDDHAKVMKKWQPYFELSRNAAGSAAFFGGKRNIGGDGYLGYAPIGNAMVALSLASARHQMFMHGGKKQGWLAAGE